MTEPWAYSVRVSKRARHVRLTMSVRDGLVVVVPRRFDQARIPEVLREGRRWIERTAERIARQRASLPPPPDRKPPQCVALRAIGRECAVEYRGTDSRRVFLVERAGAQLRQGFVGSPTAPDSRDAGMPAIASATAGDRIVVCGKVDNAAAVRSLLKRWLHRKAHEHLAPWLIRVADERQFELRRVLVKSQRTRWASCSRKGTINVNLMMLFLPPELVHYIFLHELCHTVHPNHSARFWSLVRRHAPDFKAQNARLREAWRLVPAWLELRSCTSHRNPALV